MFIFSCVTVFLTSSYMSGYPLKKKEKQDSLQKQLGYKVRQLRQSYGMTQEKLAEYLEVHPSYPGQLERGERSPSLETLKKLASTFHLPLAELLTEEQQNENSFWKEWCDYLLNRCTPAQLKGIHELLAAFIEKK